MSERGSMIKRWRDWKREKKKSSREKKKWESIKEKKPRKGRNVREWEESKKYTYMIGR